MGFPRDDLRRHRGPLPILPLFWVPFVGAQLTLNPQGAGLVLASSPPHASIPDAAPWSITLLPDDGDADISQTRKHTKLAAQIDAVAVGNSGSVLLFRDGVPEIRRGNPATTSARARFDPCVLQERLLRGEIAHAERALRKLHDTLDHLSYAEVKTASVSQLQATLEEVAAPPKEERGDRAADLFVTDWGASAEEESRNDFSDKHLGRLRQLLTGMASPIVIQEGSAPEVEVKKLLALGGAVCAIKARQGVLDEQGKRFYTLAHIAVKLAKDGEVAGELPLFAVAWALHSETQEILLEVTSICVSETLVGVGTLRNIHSVRVGTRCSIPKPITP